MTRFEKLSIAFCLWQLMTPLQAAQAQSGLRFQTDPNAPLNLKAEKMLWDQKAGRSDLSGRVRVRQGPMQVTAARMQVRFGADGAAESLTAQDNVVLINEDGQRAEATRMDFDLRKDILLMRENVVMQAMTPKGQNQKLSGAALSIDMVSGQARLTGGKNRARIELQP